MEENRGTGRGSYIAGQSVHNSRIERLWRDVYRAVSSSYVRVFYDLENDGALDVDNEADLFCLHYIFIARINESLHAFKEAWNNHTLSTENNMSPLQLYMAYSQGSQLFDEIVDPVPYIYNTMDDYDDEDDDTDDDPTHTVVVPQLRIPLSITSLQQLAANINPLQNVDDFGEQLYLDTVQMMFTLMNNDGLLEDRS